MWPKQKQKPYIDLMSSHIFPSSSSSSRTSHYHLLPSSTRGCDSWEEQAFAEDAAGGALGGCIWPPRSYSCTFCKREFRSAQALGGHMNVHRRDRARLKQSQAPQIEPFPHNNHQEGTILEAQSHHQTCNFLFNPILDEFDNRVVATPSCPIRVSSNSRLDYHHNNETQYLFPYVQEQSTIFHPKSSSYHSESQARFSTTTARPNKRDFVKADLSISLNLVICTTNNLVSSASDDDGRCKKRRIDPASALNLFDNEQDSDDDTTTDEQLMMMRTMNHTVSCIDDVDLDLRLGVSPKVK